jgi:hypothetical protein
MAVGKVVLAVEDEHGSREVGCRLHTTQAEILPNRHRGLHVLGELEKSRIKARVSEKEELDELMGNGDLMGNWTICIRSGWSDSPVRRRS